FPRPPVVGLRRAAERSLAGDRDVRAVERVDEGRVIVELRALESREDGREIVRGVLTEGERRAAHEVQVDVAFEVHRAGEESPSRYDDATAACRAAFVNGTPDRRRAVVAPAGDGAVTRDLEIAPRKGGPHRPAKNFGHSGPRVVRWLGRAGCGRSGTGKPGEG